MRRERRFFVLLLTIIIYFLSLNYSYAFRIVQLDQAKIRLKIPAGGSKSGRIEVKNNSEEPKEIKADLEDWVYEKSDGSKNFFSSGSTPRSCAPWIKFSPAEFTVPAFGKTYVNYIVNVPKEVKGGYYAGLFFESLLGKPEEQTEAIVVVPVGVSVGSLFYIEVEGTVDYKAQLEKLSLKRKFKDSPLEINFNFKNTGNIDINAGGNFNLIDKEGMVFARGEFNDVYTLPGDTAELSAVWREPLSKGKYDLIITLDLGRALEELGIGRGPILTKEAEIEIGENGQVVKVGELR